MTDQYIYTLLSAWGRFRRWGWDPRLGYDKINLLLKLPGGGEDEEVPEDVAQVDVCIGTLPSQLREALRQKYEKRRSLRIGGRKMAISKDRFCRLLSQAEQRVAGYMQAINIRESA